MIVVRRVIQLAVLGALALSAAACTCPGPVTIDQVFLLDATAGDGGGPGDAGGPADGAVASQTSPFDCTAMAAGCVPGGACRPACDCVLARDGVRTMAIKSCTLLAGAGAPEVEVLYQPAVFCGGD